MDRQNSRITRKMLVDWAGEDILRRAKGMMKEGLVLKADFEPPVIEGAILCNNRELKTGLKILPDGHAENHCPCYDNTERGLICSHVIALALTIVERTADPLREAKYKEEARRATRLEEIDESEYIQRVPMDTSGATPAKLRLTLPEDWQTQQLQGKVTMKCEAVYRKAALPLDKVATDIPLAFDKKDESMLFVLEDISEGPAKGEITLNPADFINVVRLRAGREIKCGKKGKIFVNETEITTHLKLEMDRETGELLLLLHTELPFMDSSEQPTYVVSGKSGWVYGADNFWPMETVLPVPYHQIYTGPIRIARNDVIRFLDHEVPLLKKSCRIETEVFRDLFATDPAKAEFRLLIKGSPAALAATLYAVYDGIEIVACKPDPAGHFAVPDPDDLMHYGVRNMIMEKSALEILAPCGFRGMCGDDLTHIDNTRGVLNFLGTSIPMLNRRGWRVELEGRVAPYMETVSHATPVVHISDSESGGWFDVSFDFEDHTGSSLSQSDIHNAIRKGESYIKRGDSVILIDTDAVESMQDVFSDCASIDSDEPGHFRMPNIYTPFVKSSLEALDGIDIEDPPTWRSRADIYNRNKPLEDLTLEPFLNDTLRPYQKEGVHWMHFMKHHGFCGILADEMGLGKTLQTLAWISTERKNTEEASPPAIIICPTSIVENWADEVRKFVPHLKPLVMAGSDRHENWDDLESHDIIITSYALLRRDLDEYLKYDFSTAVLDEAQHIKNRSTQNAVSAKKIKAAHRLVLTGTPVENSVADLWSIMDFLMPGYLDAYDVFRQNYELPVSRGGPEAEAAQTKLKRKLHPFLLRRLKTTVAKDLPGKIEKVFPCPMSVDQQRVYEELLRNSRRKISNMVAKNGFNKSRMEIFTLLLRLRQASCHLDLLKLPGLKPEYPSGKMNIFFELMDEALDSGHRILVFSQFVSMLKILAAEMDKKKMEYCYLDGSTKDRIAIVKQFNTQRSIPAFLISLKAGGTGLNLTGADMVVHFDPWWNPAVENQATDRAHRIGQKNTVYSIKLISKGTVEEKVLEMQNRKKAVIQATVESDQESFNKMTWDDVQDILSL